MTSYQYRKSHWGDKTILRPSYLHNGISYTCKMTSLYWIGALVAIVPADGHAHNSARPSAGTVLTANSSMFCLVMKVLYYLLWPMTSFKMTDNLLQNLSKHFKGCGDAIWWHRSGTTLVQVMACCLMASSHYLNWCWLYHQWGSVAFTWEQSHSLNTILYNEFETSNTTLLPYIQRQWVNSLWSNGIINIRYESLLVQVMAWCLTESSHNRQVSNIRRT